MQITSLRERPLLPSNFPSILSTFPTHVSWEPVLPCKNGKLTRVGRNKERVCLMLQSLFVCRCLLTGGTVTPVSLTAVVPTVMEKSVFYGYLTAGSASLGLPTQFVHCCLLTARAFMLASLVVIPYTILEISKFLGQLPVKITII